MKLRGILSLVSIQSTPVTVATLGLGYATVSGTILREGFIHLVVAGAIAHWAFYCLNDLRDIEWDKNEGREHKPLVNGSIGYRFGVAIFILLFAASVTYALAVFPLEALFSWSVAIFMGFWYNENSKSYTFSGVYMFIWGLSVVFTGALYAGGYNGTTVILGLLVALHMFWMTVMGNLKDIGGGENSIPEMLDCKIVDEDGYKILWTSGRFNIFASVVILLQIALLLLIPIGDSAHSTDVTFIYIGVIGGILIWDRFANVLYQPGFKKDRMKRDIAVFEIVSVSFVIAVCISFMTYITAVILIAGSIVWGVSWQTLLYRHPLRFP